MSIWPTTVTWKLNHTILEQDDRSTITYDDSAPLTALMDPNVYKIEGFEPGRKTVTVNDAQTDWQASHSLGADPDDRDKAFFVGIEGDTAQFGYERLHTPFEVPATRKQVEVGICACNGYSISDVTTFDIDLEFDIHLNAPETRVYFDGPDKVVCSYGLTWSARARSPSAPSGPGGPSPHSRTL
jgi:hypothetical protein